jgi:hypothetical protein
MKETSMNRWYRYSSDGSVPRGEMKSRAAVPVHPFA